MVCFDVRGSLFYTTFVMLGPRDEALRSCQLAAFKYQRIVSKPEILHAMGRPNRKKPKRANNLLQTYSKKNAHVQFCKNIHAIPGVWGTSSASRHNRSRNRMFSSWEFVGQVVTQHVLFVTQTNRFIFCRILFTRRVVGFRFEAVGHEFRILRGDVVLVSWWDIRNDPLGLKFM